MNHQAEDVGNAKVGKPQSGECSRPMRSLFYMYFMRILFSGEGWSRKCLRLFLVTELSGPPYLWIHPFARSDWERYVWKESSLHQKILSLVFAFNKTDPHWDSFCCLEGGKWDFSSLKIIFLDCNKDFLSQCQNIYASCFQTSEFKPCSCYTLIKSCYKHVLILYNMD